MTPKLKSLIYLMCFILCCIIYDHVEKQESKKSLVKSSNFAIMEMNEMDESENLNLKKKVPNEKK